MCHVLGQIKIHFTKKKKKNKTRIQTESQPTQNDHIEIN